MITMTEKAKKLLEEALKLPVEARADLAGYLINSLDDKIEAGAEEAWATEIAKRIEDIESGRVKSIPWSEARRAITSDEDPSDGR